MTFTPGATLERVGAIPSYASENTVGRDELEQLLRDQLAGTSLVAGLLEERRQAAAGEDAE